MQTMPKHYCVTGYTDMCVSVINDPPVEKNGNRTGNQEACARVTHAKLTESDK